MQLLVASVALAGCAQLVPARPPGRSLALISFDGPFATETELCTREVAAIFGDQRFLAEAPRCALTGPSFELPAPDLPAGHDQLANVPPFRSVHVVPLMAKGETDRESPASCLLVIETARGWFASERVIDRCDRGEGTAIHWNRSTSYEAHLEQATVTFGPGHRVEHRDVDGKLDRGDFTLKAGELVIHLDRSQVTVRGRLGEDTLELGAWGTFWDPAGESECEI